MKTNVRALTQSAVSAALAVVLLWIGSAIPSGKLAFTAIAGLAALFVMLRFGGKWAIGVYLVSMLLGLLLAPSKGYALLYAAFLGYYPALKSVIERVRQKFAQWAIKIALFNVVLAALFLLARTILTEMSGDWSASLPIWLLWVLINIVFVLYDFGLTGLIRIFVRRFAGK